MKTQKGWRGCGPEEVSECGLSSPSQHRSPNHLSSGPAAGRAAAGRPSGLRRGCTVDPTPPFSLSGSWGRCGNLGETGLGVGPGHPPPLTEPLLLPAFSGSWVPPTPARKKVRQRETQPPRQTWMLWGLRAQEPVSPQKRKMERVQQPRGRGEGRRDAAAGLGRQTVTDAPGRGQDHREEPGPTGPGDWKELGCRQSRKKQGRGQAAKTGTYLRRGLGEGGPGGGCPSRLGLMVDSDLGRGSGRAIRRWGGALVPFCRCVVTAERDEGERARWRGAEVSERERGNVCVTGCVHAHVCVHVDPGKLRVRVCPQTH